MKDSLETAALLEMILHAGGHSLFAAGGPVRDWLSGHAVTDIDLVMAGCAIDAARDFARQSGGTFVLLDQQEDVARVVINGLSFDFSSLRKGAKDILQDLAHRDFTINAMAVPLQEVVSLARFSDNNAGITVNRDVLLPLLEDPFGGLKDLDSGIIRAVRLENLRDDPLRMLRAFRFMAVLGFSVHQDVIGFIRAEAGLLRSCSQERISYELERIMASSLAGDTLKTLHESNLMEVIIPEIRELHGVEQPGFHHLDVLGHCLETVSCMDRLVSNPAIRFDDHETFQKWLSTNTGRIPWLKWAALLHDFGKPSQKGVRNDGRVTFYEHDKKGSEMAGEIGSALRWSRSGICLVKSLVRMHMRPFHLLNDLRRGGPSKRALRRLLEDIGADYPALFLLAMADSMAGCGPLKPEGLDHELSVLFDRVHEFYMKRLAPSTESRPLLNGREVMELFGIGPGPMVGKAIRAVEALRIEGILQGKDDAINWLREHFPHDLSVS